MRLQLSSTGAHCNAARLSLDGVDISSCVRRIEIDAFCDDVTAITIHAIAADGVDVDVAAVGIKIIERAFQVSHPNANLEKTPIRELLSETEVEPDALA